MPEGSKVQSMFAGIAGRYDLANHALSMGVDHLWRHKLVRLVRACQPIHVADLATGSGDVALALQKALGPSAIVQGYDFCQPMLDEADKKKTQHASTRDMTFAFGDCLNLPLADESMDVLTIAFGLRNLEDRLTGLQDMHRVLRPGGSLFVLEFSQPYALLKPVYYLYLKFILPVLAKTLTHDKAAYDYLAGSIEAFPSAIALDGELLEAGYRSVKHYRLSGGIVAIHQGVKKKVE